MTWGTLLDQWSLIECDLADRGIDVGDPRLMADRSWRWLRVRILGLLDTQAQYVTLADGSPLTIPSSRIGRYFHQT